MLEDRFTLSTFFPEEGPDQHFVSRIWKKDESSPRFHDFVRGPFQTKEEARTALEEIEGQRYAPADEGNAND